MNFKVYTNKYSTNEDISKDCTKVKTFALKYLQIILYAHFTKNKLTFHCQFISSLPKLGHIPAISAKFENLVIDFMAKISKV